MRPRAGWLVTLLACAPALGCATYHPPFSVASAPDASHPSQARTSKANSATGQATLVVLWPATSCDPPGYYTLVTADGRFVGTIARGKQLRAEVPAGDTTLLGWNEVREAAAGGSSIGTVPVLRAHMTEGRTYYVRMALGEWDEMGPGKTRWTAGSRRCAAVPICAGVYGPGGATSAMVTITPGSASWSEVPGWMANLEPIAPDQAAGQAWVDAQGEQFRFHIALAEERYEELRPNARRMATVEMEDGVATR